MGVTVSRRNICTGPRSCSSVVPSTIRLVTWPVQLRFKPLCSWWESESFTISSTARTRYIISIGPRRRLPKCSRPGNGLSAIKWRSIWTRMTRRRTVYTRSARPPWTTFLESIARCASRKSLLDAHWWLVQSLEIKYNNQVEVVK